MNGNTTAARRFPPAPWWQCWETPAIDAGDGSRRNRQWHRTRPRRIQLLGTWATRSPA